MTALLAIVIALIPLVIAPHLLFYYDVTPKVALLLAGTALVMPGLRPRALWSSREGRWLLGLVILEVLSLTLSTALSIRPDLSLAGTAWRRFSLPVQVAILLFITAAAASLAGKPARIRLLLRVLAVSGIPVALYGILQYFGWDPWLPKEGYHIGEGYWIIVRPPATLGYVSYFATYLLYVVFASIGVALVEQTGVWRAVGIASASLAAIAIVFSGTRAAILGLLVGIVLLVLWRRPAFSKRAAWAAATALTLAVLFYYSPAGQMLRTRTRWFVEDTRGGPRLWLWRDSLRMGLHLWEAGAGPETFSGAFPHFQSVSLSRQFPDFYHESAHNLFLDTLTAQGLPGLAALLGFCVLGFAAAWRARGVDPKLSGALAAALAASLFSQQFTVFIVPTALFFYLTIALLVAQATPPSAETSRRFGYAALPVSAMLLFLAVRLTAADRSLLDTKKAIESGQLRAAASSYVRASRWGLAADLWYARAMAFAAKRTPNPTDAVWASGQALESAQRATRTAEDPQNAWHYLASLYGARNDLPHTEQSLRAAIAASPNWFKPHWLLAQVLTLSGRRDEALREAATAAGLNGGKNPEVARTLAQLRAHSLQQ